VAKKKSSRGQEHDLIRIACFMLFDAMLFHVALANNRRSVMPLSHREQRDYHGFFREQWIHIRDEINYRPVFSLAIEILDALPAAPETERMLEGLAKAAEDAVRSGILLKHDFVGRIYHKLLLSTTGHYYATYYTSLPAAWLLAGLIFRVPNAAWDFSSLGKISAFRIIDPACGSGTLLSAAYSAIRDQYILQATEELRVKELHSAMLEKVINGWDVLDFAAHLTLTTLALHSNEGFSDHSRIYKVPFGAQGSRVQLGSLDYLRREQNLEKARVQRMDGGREADIQREKYDVVLMNPPFSRSAKPNIKFGFGNKEHRKRMSEALSLLGKDLHLRKAAVAGLTPFFMQLSLDMLKRHGRTGMVVPRSTLSGVGSLDIRRKFEKSANVQFVVSNFDPGSRDERIDGWSWSENTDLGEVLIVAENSSEQPERYCTFVNVFRKPRNEVEALILSQTVARLSRRLRSSILEGEYEELKPLGQLSGVLYRLPQDRLQGNWLKACTFANPLLNRLCLQVLSNPAMKPLHEFVKIVNREPALGRDIAAIKASFQQANMSTGVRLVLGHQSDMAMFDLPASQVKNAKPRDEKSVAMYRNFASDLLIAERPHLLTEALLAMRVPERVLATAFWEVQAKPGCEEWLLLWLNSTYGVVSYLANSTSSMADIFKMKKDQLRELPVPGPTRLHDAQLLFARVRQRRFMPYSAEFTLASRGEGARYLLDEFFRQALELPVLNEGTYLALSRDPPVSRSAINERDQPGATAPSGPALHAA
jgi:N-6 DNA methylase